MAALGTRSAQLRQPIFRRRAGREYSGRRAPGLGDPVIAAALLACAAEHRAGDAGGGYPGGEPRRSARSSTSTGWEQCSRASGRRQGSRALARELHRAGLQRRSRPDAGEQPQSGGARLHGRAGAGRSMHQHPCRRCDPDRRLRRGGADARRRPAGPCRLRSAPTTRATSIGVSRTATSPGTTGRAVCRP